MAVRQITVLILEGELEFRNLNFGSKQISTIENRVDIEYDKCKTFATRTARSSSGQDSGKRSLVHVISG